MFMSVHDHKEVLIMYLILFFMLILLKYVEYYISAGFNFQSFSEKKIHVNLIEAGRGKYTDIII